MQEEQNISIINRSNKEVIGERASALPVKIMSNLSWIQYLFIGFLIALVLLGFLFFSIQKNVVSVEVSGQSPDFQIFEVK